MTMDEARELFAYNRWANGLVFSASADLSADQLRRSVASSFPSVAASLAHVVSTEWVWLQRWLGESPTAVPTWVSADLAELRARLTEVEGQSERFLAGLADADLARAISYRTLSGQAHADPLGHTVRHVVNHSTYHRGQVATQFRQLGVVPPATDFIAFVWQAK
jgi:uncharacterized damage-inducible protein DinB